MIGGNVWVFDELLKSGFVLCYAFCRRDSYERADSCLREDAFI